MNSTVTAVESFRFLATTISQELKWDNHIESIVKKKAKCKETIDFILSFLGIISLQTHQYISKNLVYFAFVANDKQNKGFYTI